MNVRSSRAGAALALVVTLLTCAAGTAVADPVTYGASAGIVDGSLVTRFTTSGSFDGAYLFDVEVWNGGTRVYQDFETRNLHGSAAQALTRSLPPDLNGSYTIRAGVFSADWSVKYLWEGAGSVTVGRLGFTARSTTSGQQYSTTFTANRTTSAELMFDVELWSGGTRVYQYHETARPADGTTYTLSRALPGSVPRGSYTAKVGVFSADWSARYLWSDDAGSLSVPGPGSSPAFSASSSVSGSTFRTEFGATGTDARDLLFDVELWDGGTRVYQWTQTMPVTGSQVTISKELPSRIATGTYTAKAGVWSPGWANTYLWNDNTGTVTVSTAGAVPLTVAAASAVSGTDLHTVFRPSSPLFGRYLLDVELWSGGRRAYQYFAPVVASGGAQLTLTRSLPGSLPAGTYTARAGVFSPDWSTRYSFSEDAGTVSVGAARGGGQVQVQRSGASLTATFSGPAPLVAGTVLDVEIWDGSGTRVAQNLDRLAAQSGGTATSTVPIPAALANGGYTVRAGALAPDLRTAGSWNDAAGTFTVTSPPTGAPDRTGPLGASGSWRLAFGDEFNADTLDRTRWSTCSGQMSLVRDQCFGHGEELQSYSPGGVSMAAGAEDGVRGVRLTARSDGSTWAFGHDGVTAGAPLYGSGMLSTSPATPGVDGPGYTPFSFTYGFFEVRMKVPAGQGIWPAAWLFPADQAGPSEIDLVEVLGHEPRTAYMSVHYRGGHSTEPVTGADLSAGFHTYGVDWQPDRITWYLDGQVVRSQYATASNIPAKPMYPMLNLAVGGSWPGPPDATTPATSSLVVDWLRIWQR